MIGAPNLPATVPTAASTAYSRNMTALLLHMASDGSLAVDPQDEIQAGVVITHDGRVIHPGVAALTANEPTADQPAAEQPTEENDPEGGARAERTAD
jgi:NAD(P) transhydrogenase subunit alpha